MCVCVFFFFKPIFTEIPLPSSPSKQLTHVISEPKETSKWLCRTTIIYSICSTHCNFTYSIINIHTKREVVVMFCHSSFSLSLYLSFFCIVFCWFFFTFTEFSISPARLLFAFAKIPSDFQSACITNFWFRYQWIFGIANMFFLRKCIRIASLIFSWYARGMDSFEVPILRYHHLISIEFCMNIWNCDNWSVFKLMQQSNIIFVMYYWEWNHVCGSNGHQLQNVLLAFLLTFFFLLLRAWFFEILSSIDVVAEPHSQLPIRIFAKFGRIKSMLEL